MRFLKSDAVKTALNLRTEMNFCAHYPCLLSGLGEIQYKTSWHIIVALCDFL